MAKTLSSIEKILSAVYDNFRLIEQKDINDVLNVCKDNPSNSKQIIIKCNNLLKDNTDRLFVPDYAVADILFIRALCYSLLKEYANAINDFTDVIKEYRKNEYENYLDAPYFYRGKVYFESGNYDSALKDFNNAIKVNDWNGDYYYCRGLTYKALNMNDEATKDLQKALSMATH